MWYLMIHKKVRWFPIVFNMFSLWWCKLKEWRMAATLQDGSASIEMWTLTFLFSHAKEKNDGTEDIDWADNTGGNHVGRFLPGEEREKKGTVSKNEKNPQKWILLLPCSISTCVSNKYKCVYRVVQRDDGFAVVEIGRLGGVDLI